MSILAGSLSGVASSIFVGPIIGPAKRSVTYAANSTWPNQIPDPSLTIQAWGRGFCANSDATDLVAQHGIPVQFNGPPNNALTVADGRVIPDGVLAGGAQKGWSAAIMVGTWTAGPGEVLDWYRRGAVSDQDVSTLLRASGVTMRGIRDATVYHQHALPSAGQLPQLEARGLLGDGAIPPMNVMAEAGNWLAAYARAAGAGPARIWLTPGGQQFQDVSLAGFAWAAHWSLPGYTEAIRWGWRFRGAGTPAGRYVNPDGLTFDDASTDYCRSAAGVHPDWRKYYVAAARPTLGIRQLRLIVGQGLLTHAQLVDLLRSEGYHDDVSQLYANALERQATAARQRQALQAARGVYGQLYDLGALADTDFVASLLDTGLDSGSAAIAVTTADLRHELERVKRVVATVRKGYVRGQWDEQSARTLLLTFGIQSTRIDEYITDWDLDKSSAGKHVSAQAWVKLACEGLISGADLLARLQALEYDDASIQALVAGAIFCAQQRAARLLAQESAAQEKAQRAKVAALKAAQQAVKQAQAALSRHGSPGQLAGWWARSLISTEEVVDRLRVLGWPDADIERFLDSQLLKKGPVNAAVEPRPLGTLPIDTTAGSSGGAGRKPAPAGPPVASP